MTFDLKPQQSIIVRLNDQTGVERTEEEKNKLYDAINKACEPFGFDISSIGNQYAMTKLLLQEVVDFMDYTDKQDGE
jgi:hypothetical protein